MRSPATRGFLANIFLGFSAEEFRRSSRRSALGERRGEFRCVVLKALNSGKESDGKKHFCGGTEQYIFSSLKQGPARILGGIFR